MAINTHLGKNIDGGWIIYRDSDNAFRTVLTNASGGAAIDTSNTVFSMEFYARGETTPKLTLTESDGDIVNDDGGIIDYTLTQEDIATLPGDRYFFVIKYSVSGGDVKPLAQGYTNITSETNPGSTTTSVNMNVNVDGVQVSMAVTMLGGSGASTAEDVSFTPAGNIASTDVQAAIEEVASDLSSHTSNTSNPHSVTKTQVGLGNVDNTSDENKPISSATQTALNLKAPKDSPVFTGDVSFTSAGEFVNVTITDAGVLMNGQPLALDVDVDLKAPLASPALTGTPTAPTAGAGTNTTQIATTAFVKTAADAKVADAINDGTTTIAPSQNAVFDELKPRPKVFYERTTDSSITGTTSEQIADVCYIPAGTIQANDIIKMEAKFAKAGTAGVSLQRFVVNGTAVLGGATTIGSNQGGATALFSHFIRELTFKNSLTSQTTTPVGTTNDPTGTANSATAISSLSLNFAVDQYIMVTLTPGNSGDTCTLDSWRVEIIRK